MTMKNTFIYQVRSSRFTLSITDDLRLIQRGNGRNVHSYPYASLSLALRACDSECRRIAPRAKWRITIDKTAP